MNDPCLKGEKKREDAHMCMCQVKRVITPHLHFDKVHMIVKKRKDILKKKKERKYI